MEIIVFNCSANYHPNCIRCNQEECLECEHSAGFELVNGTCINDFEECPSRYTYIVSEDRCAPCEEIGVNCLVCEFSIRKCSKCLVV